MLNETLSIESYVLKTGDFSPSSTISRKAANYDLLQDASVAKGTIDEEFQPTLFLLDG